MLDFSLSCRAVYSCRMIVEYKNQGESGWSSGLGWGALLGETEEGGASIAGTAGATARDSIGGDLSGGAAAAAPSEKGAVERRGRAGAAAEPTVEFGIDEGPQAAFIAVQRYAR